MHFCHRLMSRLPSQLLPALCSAAVALVWKKGCLREAASVMRFAGSYSSMLSIRSKSWWCSSASERRYLCKKEVKKMFQRPWAYHTLTHLHKHLYSTPQFPTNFQIICMPSNLDSPVMVCSFLLRIFLLRSCHPSPVVHDKSISVSCVRDHIFGMLAWVAFYNEWHGK